MPLEQLQHMLSEKLSVTNESPETQALVIEQLGALSLQRLTLLIFEQLSEGDREAFSDLSEKNDTSGMQQFLKEKVPNLEQLSADAVSIELKAFEEFRNQLPAE